MPAALKCPNPSCPFLFDPTQVPAGAVLTCPRCTMRFTLGGAPVSNVFTETQSPPATPSTAPEDPAASSSFFQSHGMMAIGIGACLAVTAALLALFLGGSKPPPSVTSNEKFFRDYNLAVVVPEGWESDDDVKKLARANVLAMQKTGSSARFAIALTDYKTRAAPPGELRDGLGKDRIEVLFDNPEITPATGSWLGQDALVIGFRARRGDATYAGEGYAVTIHGIAYWFLGWALEADYTTARSDLEAVRTGCRLIDPKKTWKPSDSTRIVIPSDAGDFKVIDGDRWWEKLADPNTEDSKAEMLLRAKFKSRIRTDRPPTAWAVVFKLDSVESTQALLAYSKARYEKLYGIKKWNELTGEPQGDPPAAGMLESPGIRRFHAESSDPNGSKLVVLNTIPGLGIEAWCPWNERDKWEKRLIALAASLQK